MGKVIVIQSTVTLIRELLAGLDCKVIVLEDRTIQPTQSKLLAAKAVRNLTGCSVVVAFANIIYDSYLKELCALDPEIAGYIEMADADSGLFDVLKNKMGPLPTGPFTALGVAAFLNECKLGVE